MSTRSWELLTKGAIAALGRQRQNTGQTVSSPSALHALKSRETCVFKSGPSHQSQLPTCLCIQSQLLSDASENRPALANPGPGVRRSAVQSRHLSARDGPGCFPAAPGDGFPAERELMACVHARHPLAGRARLHRGCGVVDRHPAPPGGRRRGVCADHRFHVVIRQWRGPGRADAQGVQSGRCITWQVRRPQPHPVQSDAQPKGRFPLPVILMMAGRPLLTERGDMDSGPTLWEDPNPNPKPHLGRELNASAVVIACLTASHLS